MSAEGFHIVPGNHGPHVVCRAANGETLSHSENFASGRAGAEVNIRAQLLTGFRQILAMAEASTLSHALAFIGATEEDTEALAREMLSFLIASGHARVMNGAPTSGDATDATDAIEGVAV